MYNRVMMKNKTELACRYGPRATERGTTRGAVLTEIWKKSFWVQVLVQGYVFHKSMSVLSGVLSGLQGLL